MVRRIGIYHVAKVAAKVSKKSAEIPENKLSADPANFEEAILATGFGKFNFLLLLCGTLPVGWTIMNSVSNISQIVPSVKCDFNLTLNQIGLLNAGPYIGNIVSPSLMGYLADTMGRRRVMLWALFADVIFVILCGLSVNVHMLAVFKFFNGFVITAPSGIIMSYLAECHCEKYRSHVILSVGILMGTFNIILPALAWAILPQKTPYLHSWQYLLLILAIPSLLAGIAFKYFPESPKFLMSKGKHDEALEVFQKIYSINSGKAPETYPITSLSCPKLDKSGSEERKTPFESIVNSFKQFKPLFHQPYLFQMFLCLFVQIFMMMGVNTLRLWLPQILTLVDDYSSGNATSATLCQIIADSQNVTKIDDFSNITSKEDVCANVQSNDAVYIKLIGIGALSVIMYIIVTILSSIMPKKFFLSILLFISGLSGIALIWVTNPLIILLVAALYSSLTGVCMVTFIGCIVDVFPTSFRTLSILIIVTSGRFGSIFGNLIFPILLVSGCVAPFLFLGFDVLICIVPLLLITKTKAEDV